MAAFSFIPFAVPACNILTALYPKFIFSTQDNDKYKNALEHPLHDVVQQIVKRVLSSESEQKSGFFAGMQGRFLRFYWGENVTAAVLTRFKTIICKDAEALVLTEVVDTAFGEYIYIRLDPQVRQADLPWMITREVWNILNYEETKLQSLKVAVPSAFACFNFLAVGMPWPPTLMLTGISSVLTEAVRTHSSIREADNFALKHCTEEELKRGIALLEKMKQVNLQNNPLIDIFHAPEAPRISKIQKHLVELQKEKESRNIKKQSLGKNS